MKCPSILVTSLACVAALSSSVHAELRQWSAAEGGNDHWYDIIVTPLQSWMAAKAQAESMGGYLASITSQSENDWLWNSFNIGGTPEYWAQTGPWPGYDGPVFGAYRDENDVWSWVSGEPFEWSNFNWSTNPGEAGAQFIAQTPFWDDIGVNGGTSAGGNVAFVIEYNVPAPATFIPLAAAMRLGSRRRR